MTTKWGVYVEIDTNEFMWDNGTDIINDGTPPLLFDTKEEAEEHAKRWNTGQAIKYRHFP
jgi:hypothetical protein